ncbi:sensor histidine kinase [Deinococcus ruber]|uniref:histidine kinase n=1 Tax=Deinococcus ruber TaxID=1848197 RepID=A0A918CK43_9DEIO|nr:ATP-binding protein [Deinococcus ruber]GGR27315.1 two-component sensor histidine kinase [Deinococcus ruber]
MRLLPRLFLSHTSVVVLTVVSLFVLAEVLAPAFIRHHVEEMVALIGPAGLSLREDLSRGMRTTFTGALLLASGIALGVAFVSAYLAARRVVRAVRQLSGGSLAIAEGNYLRRLPEEGQDELTELARNFNRMARALADVEASRIELITNVAHELRTPLTALQGYAEALNDGILPPEHVSAAILRETRAMERLTNDLSLVSRVEAGKIELTLHPVVVANLLMTVQERFLLLAENRHLTLQLEAPGPALLVQADAERASQVLANLVTNALKYTPAGGTVRVFTVVSTKTVAIHVQDDGPGLSAEEQRRIFERFYRTDHSRSRSTGSGGGSGVGLTIARGLARAMAGDVIVTSTPAAGSTFIFILPAVLP